MNKGSSVLSVSSSVSERKPYRLPLLPLTGLKWHPMGGASHRSRRVMKYRIGKLGEELHIEIVGKHLPFDCSGP